jgi:pilus assembly protein CpaE
MYPLAAAVVVDSEVLRAELEQAFQTLAVRVVVDLPEMPSEWPSLLERLDRMRPDVVLLNIGRLARPLEEVIATLRSSAARPAVFVLHTEADPEAILRALRAGASEFLFPPMGQQLEAALERLARAREASSERTAPGGKVAAFLSAKGGCGATTIACHVALELPRLTDSKVLLADLDLQAGLIGFLLKNKSEYSVADAVYNIQRLDQSYWRGLVSNGIPNVEFIAAPTRPASKNLPPGHLKQVFSFARTQYDWTVLDLGRHVTGLTLTMLEMADETYLVTTHEIPALHQTKQLVQLLIESGYPKDRLRLVLNRMPKRSDVTLDELESMLGITVFATLANDYQSLQEAFTEGRMLDTSSHLGRDLERLAAKIAGVEIQKKKKFSLFG